MSQSYILTLFCDDIQTQWEGLHDSIFEDGKAVYLGSQLERCPESGRLHWQAFIKFNRQSKQRGSYFKKFHKSIHWEKCSNERSAAINYGTKEETRVEGPKESGIKPSPVAKGNMFTGLEDSIKANDKKGVDFGVLIRFNLERRWDAIRTFLSEEIRSDLPPFLPNPWGLVLFSRQAKKQRHLWIWSDQPNLGKTYLFAKPLAEKYKVRIITGDKTYFNVQDSDQMLIFDEYNAQDFKYATLNAMCDGTFAYRRCGMSSIVLHNPLICILSNQPIANLYPIRGDLLRARFIEYELR